MDGSDQLSSAAVLGIALAIGLVLFFLLVVVVRAIWRWVFGERRQAKRGESRDPRLEPIQPINMSGISASDLFVIRSNINAVARQVEDLERRLRLESSHHVKETASSRD